MFLFKSGHFDVKINVDYKKNHTWLLAVWQHNQQPIRSHIRKYLLTNKFRTITVHGDGIHATSLVRSLTTGKVSNVNSFYVINLHKLSISRRVAGEIVWVKSYMAEIFHVIVRHCKWNGMCISHPELHTVVASTVLCLNVNICPIYVLQKVFLITIQPYRFRWHPVNYTLTYYWTIDMSLFSITQYCTQHNNLEGKTSTRLRTHNKHQYLALTGELCFSLTSYLEKSDRKISGSNCTHTHALFSIHHN